MIFVQGGWVLWSVCALLAASVTESCIFESCNIKPAWNFILKSLSDVVWLPGGKICCQVHYWANPTLWVRRLWSIQWGHRLCRFRSSAHSKVSWCNRNRDVALRLQNIPTFPDKYSTLLIKVKICSVNSHSFRCDKLWSQCCGFYAKLVWCLCPTSLHPASPLLTHSVKLPLSMWPLQDEPYASMWIQR